MVEVLTHLGIEIAIDHVRANDRSRTHRQHRQPSHKDLSTLVARCSLLA
jgi:hypothetical protein